MIKQTNPNVIFPIGNYLQRPLYISLNYRIKRAKWAETVGTY